MTLSKRRPGLVYPVNEAWHYVGSGGGEPAFSGTWANVSGEPKLAFRKREAGVIDLFGVISGGATGGLFTLPVGYRPSVLVYLFAQVVGGVSDSIYIQISSGGGVQAGTSVGTLYIGGQFFLTPPDVAP